MLVGSLSELANVREDVMFNVQATVDLRRCGAVRYAWWAVEAQLKWKVGCDCLVGK